MVTGNHSLCRDNCPGNSLPYSLKFSRGKYFMVLPNSAQKQISQIKFSWSNIQPRNAAVMNLKFHRRKFWAIILWQLPQEMSWVYARAALMHSNLVWHLNISFKYSLRSQLVLLLEWHLGGFTCFTGVAPQVPTVERRQCLVTFLLSFEKVLYVDIMFRPVGIAFLYRWSTTLARTWWRQRIRLQKSLIYHLCTYQCYAPLPPVRAV